MDNITNFDKVEKFLSNVCMFTDQSILDSSSVFPEPETTFSTSSPTANSTSNSFMATIKDWLAIQSQEAGDNSIDEKQQEHITFKGVEFIEDLIKHLKTVIQEKDDLRQQLKFPVDDNCLPIHYDQHEHLLEMVNILAQIGQKYNDYLSLSSHCTVAALQHHTEKLDEVIKKNDGIQELLKNLVADVEQIRKGKTMET